MNNIEKIKSKSPFIYNVTFSNDMGCEFSAITNRGVILGEPGMMLNGYQGNLPFDITIDDLNRNKELLNKFLNEDEWLIFLVPFDELNPENIIQLLEILEIE
jgi:hypothetical protein